MMAKDLSHQSIIFNRFPLSLASIVFTKNKTDVKYAENEQTCIFQLFGNILSVVQSFHTHKTSLQGLMNRNIS